MPTKSYNATMEDIKGLGLYSQLLREDITNIQAANKYSDEYKKKLIEVTREQRTAEAKNAAAKTWRRAQRRIETAKNALAEVVQAQDTGLNWSKIQVLTQEYRAQLGSYRGLSETASQRFLDVAAQAKHTAEGRRALLLAGADLLNSTEVGDHHISEARRVAREWRAEVDGPREAAELELNHAELGLGEIRNAILRIESEVTGTRQGLWMPISEWSRDIFGDTPENTGRVVWRSDLDDIGDIQGGIPDGVLSSSK